MASSLGKITAFGLAIAFACGSIQPAFAALAVAGPTTVPVKMSYNGTLVSPSGMPVKTPQTFRFSIWSTGKSSTSDGTSGTLNTSSANYAGYTEVQTVTPAADGSFFAEIGSVTPLPQLDFAKAKYLQVEVKAADAADSTYVVLDPDHDTSNALDRKPLNVAPYALNSERVGNAKVGTNAGDIATLGDGGTFTINQIPGGTNADTFTLNADDSDSNVTLQFGTTLAKTITWSTTENKFIISDTLIVEKNLGVKGDIYVDGKVDGRDIAADGTTLDTAITNIDTLAEKADALTKELTATSDALTAATTRVATLETATPANAEEIAAAKTEIATLAEKLTATNTSVLDVQSYLSAAKKELADATTAVATDLATTNTNIGTIAKTLEETTARVTTTETTLKELTATLNKKVDDNDKSQKEKLDDTRKQLDETKKEFEKQTDAHKKTLDGLKNDLATATTAIAKVDSARAALEQTVNTLTTTHAATKAALDTLAAKTTSDLATITTAIATVKNDATTAAATVAKLSSALDTTNTSLTSVTTRVAAAEQKLTANATALTTATGRLDTIDATLRTLSGRLEKIEALAHAANQDTGTTTNTFILNTDNSSGDIALSFGGTLAKSIRWDTANAKFVMNDTLIVEKNLGVKGDIYVDGKVDGRDIAADGTKLDTVATDIATLKSTATTLNAAARTILTWDYIPHANSWLRFDSIGTYTGYTMTHAGVIVGIGVSSNPSDRDSSGTFYITKNDDGAYDAADVMTSLTVNALGRGDTSNAAYTPNPTAGVAGLSFKAGDVIRIYHSDRDQRSARATLEIQYK